MSKSIDSFFGKKAALPSLAEKQSPPEERVDAAKAPFVFGARN